MQRVKWHAHIHAQSEVTYNVLAGSFLEEGRSLEGKKAAIAAEEASNTGAGPLLGKDITVVEEVAGREKFGRQGRAVSHSEEKGSLRALLSDRPGARYFSVPATCCVKIASLTALKPQRTLKRLHKFDRCQA